MWILYEWYYAENVGQEGYKWYASWSYSFFYDMLIVAVNQAQ